MIDIAHFFVLITDQGHKSQLWKTVEFKLLPYFRATLTLRLPKVTLARKQDYSTVSLYLHQSAAMSFRLIELWLPPIRPISHILLSQPGTEPRYMISCLVTCEMHWQSMSAPSPEAKWSGSPSYHSCSWKERCGRGRESPLNIWVSSVVAPHKKLQFFKIIIIF